ncbi:MAG: tRNA (guanosine(46)-N7)-methyltransferase TrmB [Alphaproteobacteria bacterium]
MAKATIPQIADIAYAYNQLCPYTQKPIDAQALAQYKGVIIGFCSADSRNQFIENPEGQTHIMELVQKAHTDMQKGLYNPRLRWFGRRIGPGMRDIHKHLLKENLPALEITPMDVDDTGKLALDKFFKNKEIWLEVGFGGGEHLIAQAKANTHIGFIGCEPYLNGVASLLKAIEEENLSNIRIWADDARALMDVMPPHSLSRVFVLFADPWPKRKHNRRRFINQENLDHLALLMKKNGQLRFASDHIDYIPWAVGQIMAHPQFEWLANRPQDWLQMPKDHHITRYQAKATKQNIPSRFIDTQLIEAP